MASEKIYNYERITFTFDGKRYTVRGKTLHEAHAKAARKQLELEQGRATAGGNMSVTAWAHEWVETYKREAVGEGQYSNLISRINSTIKPALGSKPIKNVTELDLQKLLNSQTGKSKSHISKLRQQLYGMFYRAYRLRMIPFNPAEDLQMPNATDGKRRSITAGEREAILRLAETHYAGLWIKTLLYTGLRPGETRALNWCDIDFKNRLIHVTKAMKSRTREIGAPKSAAGVRDVPIPQPLFYALSLTAGALDAPVFVQPTTGKRHTASSMQSLWNGFVRRLDISLGAELYRNKIIKSKVAVDLVPYCLRHAYGTDLQAAGVPLNVAKYLMGHADITTTANVYTHTTGEMIANVASQIDNYHVQI